MENFDFTHPVDVYLAKRRNQGRGVAFRRFASGAEAVRYLIEDVGSDNLGGTVIECEAGRFSAPDIRKLYDSPAYPLAKAAAA